VPNYRNEFSEIATFFPERAVLLARDLLAEKGWSFKLAARALSFSDGAGAFKAILERLGVLADLEAEATRHKGRFLEPSPGDVLARRRTAIARSGRPDPRRGRSQKHATPVTRIARIDPGEAIAMVREAYAKTSGFQDEAAAYLGFRGSARRLRLLELRRRLGIARETRHMAGATRR
jgi:hypothetical protein